MRYCFPTTPSPAELEDNFHSTAIATITDVEAGTAITIATAVTVGVTNSMSVATIARGTAIDRSGSALDPPWLKVDLAKPFLLQHL